MITEQFQAEHTQRTTPRHQNRSPLPSVEATALYVRGGGARNQRRIMAGEAAPGDVERGTATTADVAAALSGITLGRSYPATLPECPHCHKRNVSTKVNTHATGGTYAMCVAVGIFSALILWWIPLILDSVGLRFRAGAAARAYLFSLLCLLVGTPGAQCKKTDHTCSNCGGMIGSIEAFSDSACCKCLAKKPPS